MCSILSSLATVYLQKSSVMLNQLGPKVQKLGILLLIWKNFWIPTTVLFIILQ